MFQGFSRGFGSDPDGFSGVLGVFKCLQGLQGGCSIGFQRRSKGFHWVSGYSRASQGHLWVISGRSRGPKKTSVALHKFARDFSGVLGIFHGALRAFQGTS